MTVLNTEENIVVFAWKKRIKMKHSEVVKITLVKCSLLLFFVNE